MAIKKYTLKELGTFKSYKIIYSNFHVSTDNMNSHDEPKFYPKNGNEYKKNHILMSNIRPYFNKVWYANRNGSKSPGVLSFEVTNKEIVIPKFLYYYICSNKFNEYWSKTSKGTTMPVGDKNAILSYLFKIPDLQTQQEIINIIEPFEKLKMNIENKINKLIYLTKIQLDNTKINDYKFENFSFFQGFPFSSNDFVSNGKYKIFKIANITNLDQNVATTNNLKSNVLLKESDVVTGLSGSIGTSSIIIHNDIFLLNQRLISIKSKYPLLIKMIIEKNKKNLESLSTGSVQMNITKNDILNLKYDSSLNTKFNYLVSKKYINYSKQVFLINLIIRKIIELYIV